MSYHSKNHSLARVFKSENFKRGEASKLCYVCKENLPITEFMAITNTKGVIVLSTNCRKCNAVKDKQYQIRHSKSPMRVANKRVVNILYAARKKNKLRFGKPCTLTQDFVREIIKQPCSYCKRTNICIGLDRIESDKEYTEANIVPCCSTCNRLKLNFPLSLWSLMFAVLEPLIVANFLDQDTIRNTDKYKGRCVRVVPFNGEAKEVYL